MCKLKQFKKFIILLIFILKKLGFNLKPHQTIEELYSLISESYLTTGEGNHYSLATKKRYSRI